MSGSCGAAARLPGMTWTQKTAGGLFCLASSQQCNLDSYCGDIIDLKTECEKAAQMLGLANATAMRLDDSRGPLACFCVEQTWPLSACNGNQIQSVAPPTWGVWGWQCGAQRRQQWSCGKSVQINCPDCSKEGWARQEIGQNGSMSNVFSKESFCKRQFFFTSIDQESQPTPPQCSLCRVQSERLQRST